MSMKTFRNILIHTFLSKWFGTSAVIKHLEVALGGGSQFVMSLPVGSLCPGQLPAH